MDVEFKHPPHENGTKNAESEKKSGKRSRSNTPQLKKKEEGRKNSKNRRGTVEIEQIVENVIVEEQKQENGATNGDQKVEEKKPDQKPDVEVVQKDEPVEMDSLILSLDEPDPELQFDDNSDGLESGKSSPVLRCLTRRSQTRNIPTPKTPKSTIDDVEDKNPPQEVSQQLEEAKKQETDSLDSFNSTKAEVGGDSTRINCESGFLDDESYLNTTRERSMTETLRNLSSRRTIRPISQDYRKQAMQNRNNMQLNDNLERVHGLKRKERSETPEDRKKFKSDPQSLFARFTSPIINLKNRFRVDLPSSTPKLTGYKEKSSNELTEGQEITENELVEGMPVEDKKSWCTLM